MLGNALALQSSLGWRNHKQQFANQTNCATKISVKTNSTGVVHEFFFKS